MPAPPRTALVLGGASDIGLAIVRRLVDDGLERVVLAARDPAALRNRLVSEPSLVPRPIDDVLVVRWDVLEIESHEALVETARDAMGSVDVVVCAVGSLGHHSGVTVAADEADRLIRTNFAGPAAALLVVARALEAQGHGVIVVLSSVAGARARKSNFVYGSAKSGLDAFAQGLGDAVIASNVRVHIVRPGFVKSKMTIGLDPAPMAATPEEVAEAVAGAIGSSRNQVVWVPAKLGPAFAILRNAPPDVWRRIAGDR